MGYVQRLQHERAQVLRWSKELRSKDSKFPSSVKRRAKCTGCACRALAQMVADVFVDRKLYRRDWKIAKSYFSIAFFHQNQRGLRVLVRAIVQRMKKSSAKSARTQRSSGVEMEVRISRLEESLRQKNREYSILKKRLVDLESKDDDGCSEASHLPALQMRKERLEREIEGLRDEFGLLRAQID